MAWFSKNGKMLKVLAGVAGVSGGVYLASSSRSYVPQENFSPNTQPEESFLPVGKLPLGKVLASWTTNFKPTVPWDDNWDRRDPKILVKPAKDDSEAEQENFKNRVKENTPTSTRHLLLIRHGQYEMDHDDDKGRILTKLGREQAELTGQRLKELDHPYSFIIHSTMTRARETAEIVHKSLPELSMTSNDLLREGAPIPPEPPIGHWRPEKHQFFEDGARIEAAFRKYFHRADVSQKKDSYEVVICHANVIRYFVCRALQLPPEAWLRMSLANSSITWVTIRPSGRVSLRGLGDSGHMPKDKISYT